MAPWRTITILGDAQRSLNLAHQTYTRTHKHADKQTLTGRARTRTRTQHVRAYAEARAHVRALSTTDVIAQVRIS